MAFKLDDELLEELGLAALPPHDKQAILRQILETLEMRVGTTLASRMSDAQLDEFERLMPAEGDDQTVVQQKEQQALRWLETNFPNYKQVVNDELEKLKVEIRQSAPQILATSQQNNLPTPNLPASQMPPMPVQQPSQMAAHPLNYGQAPVTPPYVPAPQQDMQMPLTPQPGFTTPPAQYPTQPPTNTTTMQPPPQPYMPPPADNNSQPPYPSQQQPY